MNDRGWAAQIPESEEFKRLGHVLVRGLITKDEVTWLRRSLPSSNICCVPDRGLERHVRLSWRSKVIRQFVLDRVTGKMRQSLENISEEEFKEFSDLRNMKKDSFKILSKSCQDKQCFITYSVTYVTKKDDKLDFNTDVKKIAEVLSVDGKWLIADVSNVKTYHEALQPINPLE